MKAKGIMGITYVQNNLNQRKGLMNGVESITRKGEKHIGRITRGCL
jgi:hypothetical protein